MKLTDEFLYKKGAPLYRRVFSCIVRIFLFLGVFILGIVLVSFVYEELVECNAIVNYPPPDESSFHRSSLGFGVYTDASHSRDITDEVLYQIDTQYKEILGCSEEVLNAKVDINIEPAEHPPSFAGNGFHMDTGSTSQKIHAVEGRDGTDSLDVQSTVIEGARLLTGKIASDFKIVLVSKDACIGEKGIEGAYKYLGDSITIWVNQLGDVLGHEWEHVFARVLDLTEEDEEKLYSCTPMIEHIDVE